MFVGNKYGLRSFQKVEGGDFLLNPPRNLFPALSGSKSHPTPQLWFLNPESQCWLRQGACGSSLAFWNLVRAGREEPFITL